ncbi:MAG: hypothetical protein ACQEWD_11610 [Bacteroidota bacterium]
MESNKLEGLLKKFDEGRISSTEEKDLRNYFSHNEVPPHLMHYQDQFQTTVKNQKPDYKNASVKKFYVWGGVMAIIILAIGVFFLQQRNLGSTENNDLGTIQDEELALQKTRETLQMVSELMNERKKNLIYLKEFNDTRERIIKHEN